jgi:hypothetical protein
MNHFGGSSNGRTTGSGPVSEGSIPSPPAKLKVGNGKLKAEKALVFLLTSS